MFQAMAPAVAVPNRVSYPYVSKQSLTLLGLFFIVSDRKQDMILVRVYGHNSELMIDRKSEIRNMKLLHANGTGCQLYATFQNGLAYEYLPGSTLTLESVCDPIVFPAIAAACSKMHTIELPGK